MYERFTKRVIDLTMSFVLLIILSLLLVIIALLVRVTSKGPILFKQFRFGENSKKFLLYKFRTMEVDTPELANSEFNNINDYITPLGRYLRKSSLDELPQLWNIFKGQMSFIGPRPLADSDMRVIKLREKNGANLIKPGISGWAQVNGRNNITDDEKARYDGAYADNITFMCDLKILLLTVVNVLRQRDINKSKN